MLRSRFRIELGVEPRKMKYPVVSYLREGHDEVLVQVASVGLWQYEVLVAVRVLVEYALVRASGMEVSEADDFEIRYEAEREMGVHGAWEDSGDDIGAPHRVQHCAAVAVERMMAALMGVSWRQYQDALAEVSDREVRERD